MRTQQRRPPKHARPKRHEKPEKPEKLERPERPEKPPVPPLYHRFRALWLAARLLYSAAAAALVLLPAGYSWRSLEVSATVANVAGSAISENTQSFPSPYILLAGFLRKAGIMPGRQPWKPSGVDYGNTRIPQTAAGKQIYLAWQYRPKKLDLVPPGVNVLSPTWFYVESSGGKAEVNDLAHLKDGKIAAWDPGQYIKAAHNGGAEVWAGVVCMNPDLSKQIVTDNMRRSEFISRIAGWVQEYGLDGINFDFEKMDPADKEQYTALIAECRKALPSRVVVSVDVTVPLDNPLPSNWWQCYDREGLGQAADYVAVMAYDNPDMEPVAAIDWVSEKIRDMLEIVPSDKLLLGVPFYGVDFQFQTKEGAVLDKMPDLDHSDSRSTISPASIQTLLQTGSYPSGKKVAYWIDKGSWSDEKGMTSYAFVDTDGMLHLIYCDDPKSLELKGRLLAFERLGGAAVWKLEFGSETLWDALYAGMTAVR